MTREFISHLRLDSRIVEQQFKNTIKKQVQIKRGRLNARVMETAGKAFYGVRNVRVKETVCKRPGLETAGN